MGGFAAVGYFLVSVTFGVILFILWLQIAIKYYRISLINPLAQMTYTLTHPITHPINRLFGFGPSLRYDWASLLVLIIVEFIKILSISLLSFQQILPFVYLVLYVAADFIIQPLNLLFYALIIRVVLSYTNPKWQHPTVVCLNIITDPLIRIGRRIVPDISGFDFSPFIMMIILKVIALFISNSLPGNLL